MTTPAADPNAPAGTPATPVAGTAPPAAPAAPPAAAKPADPPAPAAKVETPPGAASSASRVLGENDPEPAAGERIEMTSEALRKRIERGSKASLKAEFGTDDPKVLKEKLDRLAKFEADAETQRQAQLSKEQKLAEERDAEKARADAAEQRAVEIEERHELGEAEASIRDSLKDVVKPKFWRHVKEDLAQHLADSYDPEKLDAMKDDEREKIVLDWAKAYVAENPEYATKPAEAAPAAAPIAKVPLTNGVGNAGNKPPPVIETGRFKGKTLKPGQPNSMTTAEVAAWKRETGNNY